MERLVADSYGEHSRSSDALLSGQESAEASVFSQSSASLLDPFMPSGRQRQDSAGSSNQDQPGSLLSRRNHKGLNDLQIATPSGLPSSNGLRSAQLTGSFPLPPPRTPLTATGSGSPISYKSSALSIEPRNAGTTSDVSRALSPQGLLAVPPPSPSVSNSSSGGYWDPSIDRSALQEGDTVQVNDLPNAFRGSNTIQALKHQSFQAQLASPIASSSAQSPVARLSPPLQYPPRAHSPDAGYRNSRSSPQTYGNSPGSMPLQTSPEHNMTQSDWESYPKILPRNSVGHPLHRSDSVATMGTILSSQGSIGMNQALNTLEAEFDDYDSVGTPSTAPPTRSHSIASHTSSPGHTYELHRNGSVVQAFPRRAMQQSTSDGNLTLASRRLARASLVSSTLLKSAGSIDGLKNMLSTSPDKDQNCSRTTPQRPRRSQRYSSGPAPTLASLMDEDDQGDLEPQDAPYSHAGPQRPSLSSMRASSHASGVSKARSRFSNATRFTVDSSIPPLPQLLHRERGMSIGHLAKRADRASQILEHDYTPADLQEYKRERRRTKKPKSMPMMWSSDSLEGHATSVTVMPVKFDDVPVIEPMRRRRSHPMEPHDRHTKERYKPEARDPFREQSSFNDSVDDLSVQSHSKLWFPFAKTLNTRKRRWFFLAAIAVVVLAIAIGILAATVFGKKAGGTTTGCKSCLNGGKPREADGQCTCVCEGQYTGSFCQLDASCVCPDGTSDCQYKLAKSLVTSASDAKNLFSPPVNTTTLAQALSNRPEYASASDCAAQAQLLDLSTVDPSRLPRRSKWFRSVLLWDLATSQDFASTILKDAISTHEYWLWQDNAAFAADPKYQVLVHGYNVDLAFQKVFIPEQSIEAARLEQGQLSRLDDATRLAFAHVLSTAVAASTQRSNALQQFFQDLGFSPDQLNTFRQQVQASPVLFPFDATAQIGSQYTMSVASSQHAASQTFPLPISCQPNLSADQLKNVNAVEQQALSLPPASPLSNFNSTCSDRPLYGTLNLFRLRLPFVETGLPGQAVSVTSEAVKRRMSFHNSATLLYMPSQDPPNIQLATAEPFGTFDNLDSVLFAFLQQLPSKDLAAGVINFLSSSPTSPPSGALQAAIVASPQLFLIEAQVWGGLLHADIDYVTSGLSSSSNKVFGTETGNALRNWAHSSSGSKPIRWSLSAIDSNFVLDTGNDAAFQGIWDGSQSSSEADIYTSLRNANLMSP